MDKASIRVDKGSALWTRSVCRVFPGQTPVHPDDNRVTAVPAIPHSLHAASTAGSLVAVRCGGASRMVHTATTTATYPIDRSSTDQEEGVIA